MPSNQTAKSSSKSSASQGRKPVSEPSPRGQSQSQTGERDENYALISVLYHALQGAETIDQYIRDAQNAGDEELVSFFQETKESYTESASEAKALLASRLESSEDDEDEEEEEEEDED